MINQFDLACSEQGPELREGGAERRLAGHLSGAMADTVVVLKVGMTCGGCSGAVNRVLGKMEGVKDVQIDMEVRGCRDGRWKRKYLHCQACL